VFWRLFKVRPGRDRQWYAALKEIFGVRPDNIELYKLALLHRSASVVLDDGTAINNERLEFLGDAILEAIVSDFVFIEFPDRDEGFMTQLRSKIVSRVSLNQLCADIGLSRHVVHSESRGNHTQSNLYGDALEAMIGAMYLDKGYDHTNRVMINRIFRRYLDLDKLVAEEIDFKSRLIEWCQKSRSAIRFDTVQAPGSSPGNPSFVAHVTIDGIEMGRGEGSSKKAAEQAASCAISGLILADESSDRFLEMIDDEQPSAEPPAKKPRRAARKDG
jgi:ribonuclease-3